MRKYQLLFILLFPFVVSAQTNFSGVIKDSKTGEPLPFATIITNTGLGSITDADGKFTLSSKKNITQLTISYIGYQTQKINTTNKQYISVSLQPSLENLKEVIVVARENPALQIIKNSIASKNKNEVNKILGSYIYKSYQKLVVTANPDSIQSSIDSVFVMRNGKRIFKSLDSTNYNFKKEIEKHHLYITEKISQYKFQRGKRKKETILATRMAGFKNPVYEFLALDIQNFSFYNEIYELLGNKYLSPLAKNALKKYDYKILDTIVIDSHSAYMIYFKPKKKSSTVGLEGVLYINFKSFALEKGVAELKGIIHVKAIQNFSYKTKYNVWFPNETKISISKGKSKENVSLFGGAVQFEKEALKQDSILKTKKNKPDDISYVLSKSKNFEIEINIPIKVINSASTIEIDDNASKRDEQYWNRYRTDSITKRGLQAYKTIDSLSEKEGVENKLNIVRKIAKGYFPTAYFDIDLSQVINFNNLEGFRLGFGAITNTDFSHKLRFEGYSAYGFHDKKFKYHFGSSIRLNKQNNTWMGIGITNDLKEAAKLDFLFDDTSFSLINPRNLNISQFFRYKTVDLNLQHDILPNLEAKLKLERGSFEPTFNYQFITKGVPYSNYNLTLGSLALQWTPFNKYMNTPIGKITIKKGYPKITGQITQSFDNFSKGDFYFTQINFKLEHQVKLINRSSMGLLIQGGYTFGEAPLTHLYNAFPNYSFQNPWRRRINFSGTNAFETMAFNEFISDRYISIQARQNLARFKITSKFKPRLSIITRFAIGTIDNQDQHVGVTFKKMNRGYLESGFVLNHLFKGFGISSFYRYGAYTMPKFSDNLAVKLTYVLSLGF